jgi:signal peptidase I
MDEPRFFPPMPPTASSAEEALAPPGPPASRPPAAENVSPGKGVKETIESILIAFILAFVFRAFVVEAFVIPTGSMAPTLLGAHVRYTCRDCGHTFDVNFPTRGTSDDMSIPDPLPPLSQVYCPNCRLRMNGDEAQAVRYGDRILVLKYLYMLSDPHRWDVVVFKTPDSGARSKDPPYTVNYIKRLVGLPEEELMILFGDLYVNAAKDPGAPKDWRVQTKPRHAQEALWRLIYDNDFRPLNKNRTVSEVDRHGDARTWSDGWTLPWKHAAGDGWDTGTDDAQSRAFTFDKLDAPGAGKLVFDHASAPASDGPGRQRPDYFTDWLGYDVTMGDPGSNYGLNYTVHTVTDLRLCFSYQRQAGDGPLRARMTKLDHAFTLEILPDRIRLLHEVGGRGKAGSAQDVQAVAGVHPGSVGGAPLRVEMANADYRFVVRINDQVAFDFPYPPDQKEVDALLDREQSADPRLPAPSVSIEASRQRASVSHLSLWRDVYYTPQGSGLWSRADAETKKLPYSTRLGKDEYFVLGDNSAASSDARFWDREVNLPDEDLHAAAGRVPGRFLLGRAFFVYWPAGYKPFGRLPALVPDFGDMRLIR